LAILANYEIVTS